jgi:hypothetical protein
MVVMNYPVDKVPSVNRDPVRDCFKWKECDHKWNGDTVGYMKGNYNKRDVVWIGPSKIAKGEPVVPKSYFSGRSSDIEFHKCSGRKIMISQCEWDDFSVAEEQSATVL